MTNAILQLQEGGTLHVLKEKWWKRMHGGGQCEVVMQIKIFPLVEVNILGEERQQPSSSSHYCKCWGDLCGASGRSRRGLFHSLHGVPVDGQETSKEQKSEAIFQQDPGLTCSAY